MAARSFRLRVVACCCLAGIVVLVSTAAAPRPGSAPAPGLLIAATVVRVLQMNLCGSGLAGCYTGRAVDEAAAVIRRTGPDLVTLNEVCGDDVGTLARAMGDGVHGDAVTAAFQPAHDRRTGGPYRCRNGRPYGIGLLGRHWPATGRAPVPQGAIYPVQDLSRDEERAWLCVDVGAFTACTTHLVDRNPVVARDQCRHLLDAIVPRSGPVVVAGDLNLRGNSPEMRSCVPPGDHRADDGGVQDVVATPDFRVTAWQRLDLRGTTDHPGLLVTLELAPAATSTPPPTRPPLAVWPQMAVSDQP